VPFNFLRRKKAEPKALVAVQAPVPIGRSGTAFDGLTEEWRLLGRMQIEGRQSDALNQREAIELSDVRWEPIDGSAPLSEAPGLRSVDPYDLILVLAGEGSMPEMSEAERAAHKVHKVSYDVALEAPPFRITGTVFMHPGSEPDRLLDRATEMFVAVVDAVAMLGDKRVGDPEVDTILVNRFYLRGIEQIDKRSGMKAQKLPGMPLGGTTWQDRS
jgi:hypothetical protein